MIMKTKEKLIKSKERVREHAEVYTPSWLVKDMCDMVPEEMWEDISKTFLEPACGNGNFLVEILKRKLDKCKDTADCFVALSSIYGIDILPDNVEESKQRMIEIFADCCGHEEEARAILDRNIICGDSLKIMDRLREESWDDILNEPFPKEKQISLWE